MVVEHKIHPLTARLGTDEVGGMFHFRPRDGVIPSVERDPASVSRRQPPCPAASSLALLGNDNSTLKSQNSKPITMKEINWKEILKLLIAILTAIAGTLGIVSCMN